MALWPFCASWALVSLDGDRRIGALWAGAGAGAGGPHRPAGGEARHQCAGHFQIVIVGRQTNAATPCARVLKPFSQSPSAADKRAWRRMGHRRAVTSLLSLGSASMLLAFGGWYVVVAGAPQLDRPAVEAPDSGLRFTMERYASKAMGQDREYGVILPPDYDRQIDKHYPVVFLLHGGHDDARAWHDKIGITPVLRQLYQSHKLPPLIVITPDGNDRRGSSALFDPDYFDGPNGNVGTQIGVELPDVVKSRYRTLNSPKFWAIGGLSSGGWGALNIGLRHLDQFHIFFSHIGYFTDASGPQNSPQQFIAQIPPA